MAQIAADPGRFAAQQPLRTGGKMTVFTPDYSMKVEVEPTWVPLAALVESTDDRAVQMRDRTRMASDQQIAGTTRKGVFQPLALFPGTMSDRGSTIVGGGNRIISGHGRKRMLDTLAAEGRFGEYLDATIAEAQRRAGLPLKDGVTEAKGDADYAEAPVTPDPESPEAAAPVQTPPVVEAEPEAQAQTASRRRTL